MTPDEIVGWGMVALGAITWCVGYLIEDER